MHKINISTSVYGGTTLYSVHVHVHVSRCLSGTPLVYRRYSGEENLFARVQAVNINTISGRI